MSETPPWVADEVRALALALFSPTPTSVSAIEAAMLAVAARVERETREADAQLVDSCSLGNHGLVRLLDDDKTLRPVASAIRSTPTIYQEPDMSEKPKPVEAWGLFMRGKKIPFEVFETKQAAIWRAEVFYLDYNEKVSVIPVTITAKEE